MQVEMILKDEWLSKGLLLLSMHMPWFTERVDYLDQSDGK